MGDLGRFSIDEIFAELENRKVALSETKQVDKWPDKLLPGGGGGQFVVELTVRECLFLGGKVEIWDDCGTTGLKCVGQNGNEMCIDEIKK